ncbi:hypothetical protein HY479_03875 [Candidatus Uhrbacteria bacterium]|nr:hypothetical protein [Candidatus Uhrbacteria bacterium]
MESKKIPADLNIPLDALRALGRLLLHAEWVADEAGRRSAMIAFLTQLDPTRYTKDGLGRKNGKIIERMFLMELHGKDQTLAQTLLAAKSRAT